MAVTYEVGRSRTVVVDFDDWVAARGPALLRLAHVLTGSQEPTRRIAVLGSEGYLATAVLEGCAERQGIYFSGSALRLTPAATDVLSSIG